MIRWHLNLPGHINLVKLGTVYGCGMSLDELNKDDCYCYCYYVMHMLLCYYYRWFVKIYNC